MEYLAKPNLILESLLYLCARADGQERQRLEEHFRQKSPHALAAFQERYASFEALKQELDRRVAIAPGTLTRLFSNLEGFPYHMAGVYSPAFLLLAPAACRCCGDSAAFGQRRRTALLMRPLRTSSPLWTSPVAIRRSTVALQRS